jgi:hypothetical protein
MSPNWIAPYYSAAANLKFNSDFLVCAKDVIQYKNLDNIEKEHKYAFSKCNVEDLSFYNHNPIGFVYVIKLANIAFPFLGSQDSLILLQYIVFLLLSFFVFKNSKIDSTFKYFYLFLIALNPFILKYVIFNFYYFWQFVPIFIILLYLLKIKINYALLMFLIFISGFVFSFRPTVLLTIIFLLYLLFVNEGKLKLLSLLVVFVMPLLFTQKSNEKNFYHTSYVGLGAYDNPWDIKLSDDDGYRLYFNKTGEKLNASFGGNYFEKETILKYKEISKIEYLSHLQEEPILLIRNAVLNTLQGFSLGYNNNFFLIIVSSVLGFFHLLLLLLKKQWMIIFSIIASIGTIVPYYPPIPAYIFGNYLLIVFSLYKLFLIYNKK